MTFLRDRQSKLLVFDTKVFGTKVFDTNVFDTKVFGIKVVVLTFLLFLSGAAFTDTSDHHVDGVEIILSDEVESALNAGIELSFDCDLAMRNSWWLFSYASNEVTYRFSIKRHALSNRYIVLKDGESQPRTFQSISQATTYIADQARVLLESHSDEENRYSMRISLNKFELPAQIRLRAFVSNSWDSDTGWILWAPAN